MPLRVNNNISALAAQRFIHGNIGRLNRQLERLSSGLRVNRAADDASGLVISEGMRGELSGLAQNVRNAEQAANLLQVAEGSLQEVSNILVRMRTLAVQSASSTVNDANRDAMAAEFTQLVAEIDRIAQATTYNTQSLLSGFGHSVSASASTALTTSNATGVTGISLAAAPAGTYTFVDDAGDNSITLGNGTITQTLDVGTLLDGGAVATGSTVVANFDRLGIQVTLAGADAPGATGAFADGDLDGATLLVEEGTGGTFQLGPTDGAANRLEVGIADLRATGALLGLDALSVQTLGSARQALAGLDLAIAAVANERGKIGALQNRLSFTVSYSENEIENIQASEATIRDADVALEVSEFSRAQILLQSSNAMLSQANINAVSALSLL